MHPAVDSRQECSCFLFGAFGLRWRCQCCWCLSLGLPCRCPFDSDGYTLSADCEYAISGPSINARWWSLALYDDQGSVIDNPSQRYSFNSDELLRRADGTYRVNLSKNARPENWLPSGDDSGRNLALMLRIYSPRVTDATGTGQVLPDRLPKIERKSCD